MCWPKTVCELALLNLRISVSWVRPSTLFVVLAAVHKRCPYVWSYNTRKTLQLFSTLYPESMQAFKATIRWLHRIFGSLMLTIKYSNYSAFIIYSSTCAVCKNTALYMYLYYTLLSHVFQSVALMYLVLDSCVVMHIS